MANSAKWIKVTTDIFDDEKILLIENLPEGYATITVWFKLLCLAGKQNNCGVFMLGDLPYTDKMLATIFRMDQHLVTNALKTFEQFGMIEVVDGVITIPNWGKHQNTDKLDAKKEYMRDYMNSYRDKQKELTSKREEQKPKKHKHGKHGNVLLTDAEFDNLAKDLGVDVRDKAIAYLDEYIEEKGYKSKSHNLTIRRWVIDAISKPPAKRGGKKELPDWAKRDTDEIEKRALEKLLQG